MDTQAPHCSLITAAQMALDDVQLQLERHPSGLIQIMKSLDKVETQELKIGNRVRLEHPGFFALEVMPMS